MLLPKFARSLYMFSVCVCTYKVCISSSVGMLTIKFTTNRATQDGIFYDPTVIYPKKKLPFNLLHLSYFSLSVCVCLCVIYNSFLQYTISISLQGFPARNTIVPLLFNTITHTNYPKSTVFVANSLLLQQQQQQQQNTLNSSHLQQ